MELIIAGIPMEIVGSLPEPVIAHLRPFLREYADAASDELRGTPFDGCDGAPETLHVSLAAAPALDARPLSPVYAVRHLIEEYGMSADGYLSQDRDGDRSLATTAFSDDFSSVSCTLVDVAQNGGDPLSVRAGVAIKNGVVNCLPAFGALTFHASAIRYRGEAILFAGASGSGKSTQTALWKASYPDDVVYINDDTPILRKRGGVFYACGSPWAGTTGISNPVCAPVRAIVYVERSDKFPPDGGSGEASAKAAPSEPTIRRISGREKNLLALRSVRAQHFPVQRERQAELIFELMREIPVYRLRCGITPDAAETVKSLLFSSSLHSY